MAGVVSLRAAADALTELWSPRVVAELDDSYVKVVLKGRLRIEMEAQTVELGEGDAFVVPKGVRHNPVADEECQIMLIERKTTLHTGGEVTDRTRSVVEQLRPL